MTKPYLGDLPDPTHVYQESYFYPYSPPQGACREDLVKHRPCPLSGSDDEFVIHRIEGLQFYDDTNADALIEFKVVYNHDSGLIYTNPAYTPEGYARLFKNAAYSFKHSGGNTQDQADWLMERVEDIGKIVDVGCGQGGFLRAVKAKARLGIDTDEQPDLIGVEFVKASVEHIDWDLALQGSWPGPMVVSMLHALEHFTDPVQILKDIRAAARSHTRLFIEVPVLEKAASEDLVGFFSPMHLTHFSVATLRLMLRSCGWQVTHKEYAEGYNGFRVLCSPAEVSTYTPLFSAQKSEILELIVKAAGAHTQQQ